VRAGWRGLADELGLVVTAGSDYHGPDRLPTVARPGVSLDEPWAGRLRRWLGLPP
jgi:hypothetical protein